MRISYINGICVNHDAISNSIRDEISWLISMPGNEVCLFTYACDFHELPFTIVRDLRDVVFDTFFQSSDIVIFHFGIYYQLFNLLPVVPKAAKAIVVFHNITPKEFLPIADHETIDKSFQQMSNIAFAAHVVCDSQINQEALSSAGINVPSTVLPLALRGRQQLPKCKPSFDDGISRIVFVGRLVRSKGPIDLLVAVSSVLAKRNNISLEVCFIGNLKFSDQDVVAEIRTASEEIQARFGGRLVVNLNGDATDSVKNNLLARADLFVLPTRHEGFCVPILEAFASGCCVIAYDNSNVPYISGGFAKLVSTGDVNLIAQAILDTLELTRSEEWMTKGGYTSYCSELSNYCTTYDPEKVGQRFLHLVADVFRQCDVSYT